jgi:hypothetical protein
MFNLGVIGAAGEEGMTSQTWATWDGTKDGSSVSIGANSEGFTAVVALSSTEVLAFYADNTNGYGAACVGTVSGNSISWGTSTIVTGTSIIGNNEDQPSVSMTVMSSTQVLVAYVDNNLAGQAFVINISGTTPSGGALTAFPGVIPGIYTPQNYTPCVSALSSTAAIICFTNVFSPIGLFVYVITISSSVVTFNGNVQIINGSTAIGCAVSMISSAAALLVYGDSTNSNFLTGQVISISGTTPSGNPPYVIDNTNAVQVGLKSSGIYLTQLNSTSFIAYYNGNTAGNDYGVVVSISGTTTSGGSPAIVDNAGSGGVRNYITRGNSTSPMFLYGNSGSGLIGLTGNVSGTAITFNSPVTIDGSVSDPYMFACSLDSDRIAVTYVPNNSGSPGGPVKGVVLSIV